MVESARRTSQLANRSADLRVTGKRDEAAQLVAEGRLTMEAVAEEVGVHRRTISRWLKEYDFMARVQEVVKEFEDQSRGRLLSQRWGRIEKLIDRAEEIEAVFAARRLQEAESDDPSIAAQIATGHVVKRPKYIGHGKYSERLYEYEADTALLREYRETLKQIAVETGQWSQQAEVGGSGAIGPLVITERRVRMLPKRATEEEEGTASAV